MSALFRYTKYDFIRQILHKDLIRWEDRTTMSSSAKNKRPFKGKVRVDFANPHILEDMDYFRQAAIHFEEHGQFTF
jgi:hypothetical protein